MDSPVPIPTEDLISRQSIAMSYCRPDVCPGLYCPVRVDDKEKWCLPPVPRLEGAGWEGPL